MCIAHVLLHSAWTLCLHAESSMGAKRPSNVRLAAMSNWRRSKKAKQTSVEPFSFHLLAIAPTLAAKRRFCAVTCGL